MARRIEISLAEVKILARQGIAAHVYNVGDKDGPRYWVNETPFVRNVLCGPPIQETDESC